ncbi:hypothetical protein [Pararhodobacter sp. CCB-MM2]|uniref:hypothetical protein n=1 Tax=Pararhodobacter sp. CCB-MM2 TaxID=1786003 RepID=UPI0008330E0E|nr:hypothetical protein [Pararhodobacter sp. CCB-MM2]
MNLELEINEFLSDPARKAQLMAAAMEAMSERVTQQFKWSLPDTIAKECDDFIVEHVAPEVRAHLLANKGAIITAAKEAADQIGAKITEALVAKVTENMDRSYKMNGIVEGLFK